MLDIALFVPGDGGSGGKGIIASGDGGEGGAGGESRLSLSRRFSQDQYVGFSGKGGNGAKGGNGGAGGSGGHGARKIILQKKSEEDNSVDNNLSTNEENLLGLGKVKSYRHKKELVPERVPKLPITDFLI